MSNKEKHIVLIEDDEYINRAYSSGLTRAGFVVHEAFDGEEGLKLLEHQKPDLVVLDLIMPIMTGFDVLQALQKKKLLPNTPIIVLSNLGQDEDIKQAKELGATDYLVKSNFSMNEVIEKIKQHI